MKLSYVLSLVIPREEGSVFQDLLREFFLSRTVPFGSVDGSFVATTQQVTDGGTDS